MGNCPSCGADLGFGIVFCPNCGQDVGGEASDHVHTDGTDLTPDSFGDSMSDPHGDLEGGGRPDGRPDRVEVPDTTTEPAEVADPSMASEWTADETVEGPTVEVDASVPGSEVPPSHGGGFRQQGEDGEAPRELTHAYDIDRPPHDIP